MSTQSVLNDAEELELARLRLHALSLASLLNHSKLRSILSSSLNHLQLITTDTGNARDYRGLAELYHFEYSDVQKLSRADNPIIQLLTNVDVQTRKQQFQNGDSVGQPTPRSSIATLIRNLCSIERFDVMDDLLHELRTLQLTENEKMNCPKVAGAIKSLSMLDFEREAPDDRLTLDDLGSTTVTTIYDAYVSYADNDLAFVQSLCEFLESPQVGLKLFVRERDLLIGQMEFHAFTELMEKRCKRLLIVLSPEFLNSAECEFQTRFTMSLQIQERQRRLVPIVYRACELPALIKFLSKIDLSRGDQIPQWTWRKLIFSLRTQSQDGHFFPAPSLVLPASVSSSSPSFPLTSSPTMNAAIGWPTTSTVASNLPSDPRTRPQSTPITDVDSMSNPQVVGSFDRVKATVITELEDNSSNCSTKDTNKITSQLLPNNKTAISTSSAEPFLSRLWKKINRRPMKR